MGHAPCSLRFTVYTRDETSGGGGRIVELLNTGMIGMGRFAMMEDDTVPLHDGSKEMVLDFEDDVSDTFLLLFLLSVLVCRVFELQSTAVFRRVFHPCSSTMYSSHTAASSGFRLIAVALALLFASFL